LRAAKRLEPKNDKIYSILAGVEWELGHRDPALEAIEEGLRLNPSSAEYYLQLAQIQSVGFGKTAAAARQALVTYNRAAELAPSSTQARLGIAVCRIRIGDRSGQRILEELVRTHPYLPAALLELANLYNRQGRRKEANELLGRYQASVKETDELKGMTLRMSMQPKRAEGYREAGEMQLRSGNPQKAVVFFRRSLRLTPGDQQSRRDLALALTQSDRATEIPALLARP
jgi:tetratricopeptide (TPR) repeat protein